MRSLPILFAALVSFGQDVQVLPVQGNVYLIRGPVNNTTMQVGPEGIVLVNSQSEALAPRIMAEVRKLSNAPVLYIINTSLDAHNTSGNAALVKAGATPASPAPPAIVAHEAVFNRMSQDKATLPANWPTIEYFLPTKDFFVNGEAVMLHHYPSAHSDGDSTVYFRRSDVLVLGDLFSPEAYPVIALNAGGSIDGLIKTINELLEVTVPGRMQEGGTKVIPGKGRICEEAELVEYRDMLTIIRDRVSDGIKNRQMIAQIKASRPTRDYDVEYGATPAQADAFVDAIYQSLTKPAGGAK